MQLLSYNFCDRFLFLPMTSSIFTEEGNNEDLMTPPLGLLPRLKYVVSLPLALVIYVTTPDVRKPRFRRWVPLTFLMAILWIGVFSYVMVWMIAVIGTVSNSIDLYSSVRVQSYQSK